MRAIGIFLTAEIISIEGSYKQSWNFPTPSGFIYQSEEIFACVGKGRFFPLTIHPVLDGFYLNPNISLAPVAFNLIRVGDSRFAYPVARCLCFLLQSPLLSIPRLKLTKLMQ
ncbi:hypothetical protein [Streptomyces olivaceiscleroticus]|uniref:hypothetical protein n=1 Tax=Streptomyces olivaceiscleroticus TaxID=68245 RepID=UPI0031F7BF70